MAPFERVQTPTQIPPTPSPPPAQSHVPILPSFPIYLAYRAAASLSPLRLAQVCSIQSSCAHHQLGSHQQQLTLFQQTIPLEGEVEPSQQGADHAVQGAGQQVRVPEKQHTATAAAIARIRKEALLTSVQNPINASHYYEKPRPHPRPT